MKPAPNLGMAKVQAICEECPSSTAILVEKLNPRNLHPVRRRLCASCMRRLGFHPAELGRSLRAGSIGQDRSSIF
jgi:hypothetical protein